MKNIIIILLALACMGSYAQITHDHTYSKQISLAKLHVSGYKYIETDLAAKQIKIYNLNHSLWKTITIPVQPYGFAMVYYVTEQLFDTDNQIEFAVVSQTTTGGPTSPLGTSARLNIYNEDTSLVFTRDSAIFMSVGADIFSNGVPVFYDGSNTKMRLTITHMPGVFSKHEVYTLPGSIPCSDCNNGVTTGKAGIIKTNPEASFFPNPVSDQLRLRYKLPEGAKKAEIRIHDSQGRLVESMEVTNSFDHVLVPSSYSNGLYFYSLIVNGETIKTEKIIVARN